MKQAGRRPPRSCCGWLQTRKTLFLALVCRRATRRLPHTLLYFCFYYSTFLITLLISLCSRYNIPWIVLLATLYQLSRSWRSRRYFHWRGVLYCRYVRWVSASSMTYNIPLKFTICGLKGLANWTLAIEKLGYAWNRESKILGKNNLCLTITNQIQVVSNLIIYLEVFTHKYDTRINSVIWLFI